LKNAIFGDNESNRSKIRQGILTPAE